MTDELCLLFFAKLEETHRIHSRSNRCNLSVHDLARQVLCGLCDDLEVQVFVGQRLFEFLADMDLFSFFRCFSVVVIQCQDVVLEFVLERLLSQLSTLLEVGADQANLSLKTMLILDCFVHLPRNHRCFRLVRLALI